MKGIIYCQNFKDGIRQFDEIAEHYRLMGIVLTSVRQSNERQKRFAYFSNGDVWYVTIVNTHERGNICNIAYIDVNIPEDIVTQFIMPAIKAWPYNAYRYYS